MYARALDLSFSTGQNQFFSAGQNGPMESDLRYEIIYTQRFTSNYSRVNLKLNVHLMFYIVFKRRE